MLAYEMDFLGQNFERYGATIPNTMTHTMTHITTHTMTHNFERYPLFFEKMESADVWFKGMADAAGTVRAQHTVLVWWTRERTLSFGLRSKYLSISYLIHADVRH